MQDPRTCSAAPIYPTLAASPVPPRPRLSPGLLARIGHVVDRQFQPVPAAPRIATDRTDDMQRHARRAKKQFSDRLAHRAKRDCIEPSPVSGLERAPDVSLADDLGKLHPVRRKSELRLRIALAIRPRLLEQLDQVVRYGGGCQRTVDLQARRVARRLRLGAKPIVDETSQVRPDLESSLRTDKTAAAMSFVRASVR